MPLTSADPRSDGNLPFRGVFGRGAGADPQETWLRRLMFLGVCLPVAFIVIIQLVRPSVLQHWQAETADIAIAAFAGAAAVCFGIVMFFIIGRGYRQMVRRNNELAAVNELLLVVAGDGGQGRAGIAAVDKARALLGGIDAGLWRVGEDEDPRLSHPHLLTSLVRGRDVEVLWVAREPDGAPFDSDDQRALDTLAELTAIAQERDRGRDAERTAVIVNERLRISREMHDSLAQILAVTHLKLRAFAARPDVPEAVQQQFTDLADACEGAYTDVRETIHGLRESARDDRDVIETMRAYVEWFSRQSGVETTFRVDGSPVLGAYEGAHVLRVMQEALANVRKHAEASAAQVLLASVPEVESPTGESLVRLAVTDDGRGFDVEATAPEAHYGLRSMNERAAALGGRVTIRRRARGGTHVEMEVPAVAVATPADASAPDDSTAPSSPFRKVTV